jgi:hypothetical protein
MSTPITDIPQPAAPEAPRAPTPSPTAGTSLWDLPPELLPNLDELVIEDGKPVDGILSEKQMRLLTEPLHSNWLGPGEGQPWVVMANVGVFHTSGQPPLVPDVFLAVGARQGTDLTQRENLSYFVWLRGKLPDVAVEIVSNREGGEDTDKLREYARIGVPYYVIFDPQDLLGGGVLRVWQLQGRTYEPLSKPWFFKEVGLGIDLWHGRFEDVELTWLRWCDRDGHVIPTGAERASQAEQREQEAKREAAQARQELEQLKEKLRAMGLETPR